MGDTCVQAPRITMQASHNQQGIPLQGCRALERAVLQAYWIGHIHKLRFLPEA